jgi:disulfide bond formation protein DsbB
MPYLLASLLSAIFLYLSLHIRNPVLAASYLCCMFALFCIGIGIGVFHVGVENGWFIYKSTCTGYIDNPASIQDLKKMLEQAPTIPCDIPGPKIFDISIAGWNSIVFFIMSVITIFMISRKSRIK